MKFSIDRQFTKKIIFNVLARTYQYNIKKSIQSNRTNYNLILRYKDSSTRSICMVFMEKN